MRRAVLPRERGVGETWNNGVSHSKQRRETTFTVDIFFRRRQRRQARFKLRPNRSLAVNAKGEKRRRRRKRKRKRVGRLRREPRIMNFFLEGRIFREDDNSILFPSRESCVRGFFFF